MTHRRRQAALLPLLLTLVAPPPGAQEEDPRPAVAFRNQRRQALLESTVGAYRAGQPSQDAAGAQLEAAVVALFGAWAAASVAEPGAPSVSEIAGRAHAVIDMGSDDPMLEFIRATAENGRAVWPTVIRNLERRGYPPMRRAAALRVHGQRMERNRLTAEQADWTFDELIPALVAEAATSDFYAGDRQRVLLHEIRDLIEPLGPDRMRPIVEALELTDRVWLSSVCRADLELRTGWAARGTGFARDVPRMRGKCSQRASSARRLRRRALMMRRRSGPNRRNASYRRAASEPTSIHATGSSRPCAPNRTTNSSTALTWRRWSRTCGYGEIGEAMQLDPEVYGRASAILDRLCDTPECAADLPRNATILAAFAWRNEDWDTCRKALNRIGGTPDRTWSYMCRSTPDQITNDLRINTSVHRDALFAADGAAGAGRTADAIAQYRARSTRPISICRISCAIGSFPSSDKSGSRPATGSTSLSARTSPAGACVPATGCAKTTTRWSARCDTTRA